MSDTSETSDKSKRPAASQSGGAAGGARKTLTLTRTVEQGTVRQSFSQGRSKAVQVEVKKTRKLAKPGEEKSATPAGGASAADEAARLGTLSNREMDKRMQALEAARIREEELQRERAAEEERLRREQAEAQAKAAAEQGVADSSKQPAAPETAVAPPVKAAPDADAKAAPAAPQTPPAPAA
ncbi:MAG TPA: IF-2-associated domain-containing protein, partial [Hyphomicrobiaceae bacterium]|nr:IF-2-associated domain-containing protein [Hyphomicrobiaceae bacterium]